MIGGSGMMKCSREEVFQGREEFRSNNLIIFFIIDGREKTGKTGPRSMHKRAGCCVNRRGKGSASSKSITEEGGGLADTPSDRRAPYSKLPSDLGWNALVQSWGELRL